MITKILILVVVGVVAMMIFGNRLPRVMGDLGKGLKAFKEGVSGEGEPASTKRKRAVAKPKAAAKKTTKARKGK
jgi:sec-independent protein translocase protein TatA